MTPAKRKTTARRAGSAVKRGGHKRTDGERALSDLGPRSAEVVASVKGSGGSARFEERHDQPFKSLASALTGWKDEEAARVLEAFLPRVNKRDIADDVTDLRRWVLAHRNDSEAVVACMSVDAPEEMSIIRQLSRAGSQKLVLLVNWRLVQKEVVLKKLIAPAAEAAKILARELQAHPLSMKHPNIVETHTLDNRKGETFLVEEYLAEVLNDDWPAQGVEEAANLLFDMADALAYLHGRLKRVHGDIKPDNIGRRGGRYILLDFGIARPFSQMAEATATGSLRTRAPELLEGTLQHDFPDRADVWALGATVFNTLVGRFPLFKKGERVPRISKPDERSAFETRLRSRLSDWTRWVNMDDVPEPLRTILGQALARDPQSRPDSNVLRQAAHDNLSIYLRNSRGSQMSPVKELEQYERHLLSSKQRLKLMPLATREDLRARLRELKDYPGFADEQKKVLKKLMTALPD